jgi:DNA-binding MarR family transcriptional regulator
MTESARWFVDVSDAIFASIGAQTRDAIHAFVDEKDNLERPDLFFLQVAYGFDPEPITPGQFARRGPYSNPHALQRQMEESVERGWLAVNGPGQYRLTASGRQAARDIFAFADKTFGKIHPLPDDDMRRIVTLLGKVIEKARDLPEPPEKRALSWGAKFDPGPSAPPMVQVRRRMLDLLAFRDDVHIAAWQPYESNGQIWEALTYVWRGDAATAADLAEKLAEYRNYDGESYGTALQELVARGWIAEQDGRHAATDEGKALRQEAEDATDRYFDAAWTVLAGAEAKELQALLEELSGELEPAAEAAL